MRTLFLAALLAAAGAAQSPKVPADIDPQSSSRLPLVHREQMSGELKLRRDGDEPLRQSVVNLTRDTGAFREYHVEL